MATMGQKSSLLQLSQSVSWALMPDKQHVQTVAAHGVVATPGLEVILHDGTGKEIWRGPYLGRAVGT